MTFKPNRDFQVQMKKKISNKMSFIENFDITIEGRHYVGVRCRDYGLGRWTVYLKDMLDACWETLPPRPRAEVDEDELDLVNNNVAKKIPRLKDSEKTKGEKATEKKHARVQASGASVKLNADADLNSMEPKKLFPCTNTNVNGDRCKRIFLTEKGCQQHESRTDNKCVFPILCLQDKIIQIASSSERMVNLGCRALVHTRAENESDGVAINEIKPLFGTVDNPSRFDTEAQMPSVGFYRKVVKVRGEG
eukprot:g11258.t1